LRNQIGLMWRHVRKRPHRYTLLASIPVLYLVLPIATKCIADFSYKNVVTPAGREFPRSMVWVRDSTTDAFSVGGMGLGIDCSIPLKSVLEGIVFPRSDTVSSISLQFRQACVLHDMCYRHGAQTYGYSQAQCDLALQQDAYQLCKKIFDPNKIKNCESEANQVLMGVRIGGAFAFKPKLIASKLTTGARVSLEPYSTYFEYLHGAPGTQEHVVARLQTLPLEPAADNATNASRAIENLVPALHYFVVQPSGLQHTCLLLASTLIDCYEQPKQIDGRYGFPTIAPSFIKLRDGWRAMRNILLKESSSENVIEMVAFDQSGGINILEDSRKDILVSQAYVLPNRTGISQAGLSNRDKIPEWVEVAHGFKVGADALETSEGGWYRAMASPILFGSFQNSAPVTDEGRYALVFWRGDNAKGDRYSTELHVTEIDTSKPKIQRQFLLERASEEVEPLFVGRLTSSQPQQLLAMRRLGSYVEVLAWFLTQSTNRTETVVKPEVVLRVHSRQLMRPPIFTPSVDSQPATLLFVTVDDVTVDSKDTREGKTAIIKSAKLHFTRYNVGLLDSDNANSNPVDNFECTIHDDVGITPSLLVGQWFAYPNSSDPSAFPTLILTSTKRIETLVLKVIKNTLTSVTYVERPTASSKCVQAVQTSVSTVK
jgi:hypothetical protein